MFERLMARAAALADGAARRRRDRLAEGLREDAPAGVRVDPADGAVAVSGSGLKRRLASDPALRWLIAGRRR